MKWRGESGVLASDVVRGKNPKTFQFLSFPFIASQAVETGMRGDPKKLGHPVYSCCNSNVAGIRFPQSSRARVVEISRLFLSHLWCQLEQDAGVLLLRMPPSDIWMSIN